MKELTKVTRGRLRFAVVAMLCVAAIVALPAFAHAATFGSQFPAPGSTVHASPSVVGETVFGSNPLDVRTGSIVLSGAGAQTLVALVNNNSLSGAWVYSETVDAAGVYHPHWTWTTGSASSGQIAAYPSTLSAGLYNVAVSVKDSTKATLTDSWSFTVAANGTGSTPPVVVGANVCVSCHYAGSTDVPAADAQNYAADNAMGADCTSCHVDGFAPHGFDEAFDSAGVSGHNTAQLGTFGAKKWFDGTAGPTLQWESEIASSSLNATWLVGGQGPVYAPKTGNHNGAPISSITTGQVGTLTTEWDFPTQSVFWPSTSTEAPSTAIKGLTATSVIRCEDCHTGLLAAGPHGAAANYGLDSNYPADYGYAELTKYVTANQAWPTTNSNYNTPLSVSGIAMFPGAATKSALTSTSVAAIPVGALTGQANRTDGTTGATAVICAKCHKLETWIPTSAGGVTTGGGAVEGANTAHDSHHQDQTDGSAQCVNCHIGLPHGWKRPRLLLNTDVDVAPFKSDLQIGTTRTTSTGEVNVGNTINLTGKTVSVQGTSVSAWGKGFNGQGLQSLSGVDNHTLQTTTLGHQGMAAWTEASCQACGDHAGEDGIRIKED